MTENASCPKCHGYLHYRKETNKFQRCECYYDVVMQRRLGPLYHLTPVDSPTLVEHIGKDIALIGSQGQWMPYVASIIRKTPERFRHRVISLYQVMQIYYKDKRHEDDETPEDLDVPAWLIIYLDGTPDYRKMGELALHVQQRRRMLRRPTWFVVPGGPAQLKSLYSHSPALSELIATLTMFKLDKEGQVIPYVERTVARSIGVVVGDTPKPASRPDFRTKSVSLTADAPMEGSEDPKPPTLNIGLPEDDDEDEDDNPRRRKKRSQFNSNSSLRSSRPGGLR